MQTLDKPDATIPGAKNAVAAIRVSSVRQGIDGDSPEAQKEQIERFAKDKGWVIRKFFVFLESASKEQQPMQEAIDYCKDSDNKIDCFIIKSIDRFTRGGSLSYDLLKTQLESVRVSLIDIYGIISSNEVNTLEHLGFQYKWSVYSPSKKSEILEAERSKDELRDIMTRMVGAEIRYTQLGYWMRMSPYGYASRRIETAHGKRNVLEPHPIEADHIITAFKMRASGRHGDREIAEKLNDMGYMGCSRRGLRRSRSKPLTDDQRTRLTARQLWRMVRNPIYAGISCEKWTDYKPTKCVFDGLVSIDLFNRANKGRRVLVDHGGGNISLEDLEDTDRPRLAPNNPEFPYKRLVLCPKCQRPLHGSASTGKSGKKYPAYHCYQRGHSFRVSKQELEARIDNLFGNLKLSGDYADQYLKIIDESWDEVRKQYQAKVEFLDNKALELQQEVSSTVDKIKVLSSPTAIKCMEDELVRLEREVVQVKIKREEAERQKPADLGQTGRRLKHIFEHFDQAAKKLMCPAKKAKLFSLIFDNPPTADDLDFRTPPNGFLTGVNSLFQPKVMALVASGASKGTRTPGLRYRKPTLYPTELPTQKLRPTSSNQSK